MIRLTDFCSTSFFYVAEDGTYHHSMRTAPYNDHQVQQEDVDRARKAFSSTLKPEGRNFSTLEGGLGWLKGL